MTDEQERRDRDARMSNLVAFMAGYAPRSVTLDENPFNGESTVTDEKATEQVKFLVKPSQLSAFDQARSKAKHGKSEALREAMRLYCEKYNVDFDPEVDPRGGWQGNPNSLNALRESRKNDG